MILQARVAVHIAFKMWIIFCCNNITVLQHFLTSGQSSTLKKGVSRNGNAF